MLSRIVLNVFGVCAFVSTTQAQQYTDNIARNRAIEANSFRAVATPASKPTVLSKEAKELIGLPPVSLPNIRPAQPPPKNGTVLATVSVSPQNQRVPVIGGNSTSVPRSEERVSTKTYQESDGRTATRTTKTVTTTHPDGSQRIATSYSTRVNMSSSPAKTTPANTNISPKATKTVLPKVPVTVTTVKTVAPKVAPSVVATNAPKTPKITAASAATFSAAQRALANTGGEAAYLSVEERKVLLLINLARADGSVFLKEYVDKYIRSNAAFQNNSFAKSLYNDLSAVKGLPPLRPNMKLCNSARAHAEDIGKKGIKGHQSSNGMKFDTRVMRYVGSYRGLGENISYGATHNAALPIVLELLIDNNNKDYGHRRNILSPSFETVGVSIQQHTKYGFTCVQDFGAGIE